jgi:hypothetical protein
MPTTLSALKESLAQAKQDSAFSEQLMREPSKVLISKGARIPDEHRQQFDEYFRKNFVEGEPFPGACGICKTGVFALALAIVAFGAPAILSATQTAGIVGWLAGVLGVPGPNALAFLQGLVPMLAQGADAIAQAICTVLGPCR